MNIPNIVDTYIKGGFSADSANIVSFGEIQVQQNQPFKRDDENLRKIQTVRSTQSSDLEEKSERVNRSSEQRDEYLPTVIVVNNAIYNITDVRSGINSRLSNNFHEMQYYRKGEKVAKKIFDMLLPMGRKNLSVFIEQD